MHTIRNVVILENYTDKLGRVYNQDELKEQIFDRTFYGELGSSDYMTVDLTRVSHVVENIRFKPEGLLGDVRILDTPNGTIAQELIKQNVELVTSIRATGMLNSNNTVTDLKLITFDLIPKQKD